MTVASTAGRRAAGPGPVLTLSTQATSSPHTLFLPAIVTLKRGTRQSRQRKKREESGGEKGGGEAKTGCEPLARGSRRSCPKRG